MKRRNLVAICLILNFLELGLIIHLKIRNVNAVNNYNLDIQACESISQARRNDKILELLYEGLTINSKAKYCDHNGESVDLENVIGSGRIIVIVPRTLCNSCYEETLKMMVEIINSNDLNIIYLTNFENSRIMKAFISTMGIKAKIFNTSSDLIVNDSEKGEDIIFTYLKKDLLLRDIYIVEKENQRGIMQYLQIINHKYEL